MGDAARVLVVTPDELATVVRRAVKDELDSRRATEHGDVMTREQAAKMLHVHPHTVSRMVRHGGLRGHRIGTEWRFFRSDVLEWLRKQG